MNLTFRDAGPDDAAQLKQLFARSFTDTFGHLYSAENLATFLNADTEERWRRQLSDREFSVRIGEEEGKAVAFAKLGPPSLPFEPRGKPIELRQFYILKPWQGSGAAQELMRWAIDKAHLREADEMYLSVFIDNHRARRFYERYGFERVGRYDFMVGTHVDEDIVMRLGL